MTSTKYAFDNFKSDVASIVAGTAPFKIFPQGKFYREDRVLDITEQRLRNMEANFKSGLPRFKVPINEDHAGIGKVGNILAVEYRSDAVEGAGLYATQYEFTDEGKKLLEAGRYDAVSGEVIWTLNGNSKYQDPATGEYKDDTLVGLALTATPYFGHDQVALFSVNPPKVEIEQEDDETEEETDKPLMKGKQTMADEPQADTFNAQVEIEKLNTQLTEQKESFANQIKEAQDRAEKLSAQLATEQKNREMFALKGEAEAFTNLALTADEYADRIYVITKTDPALAKWVKDKFTQFDAMIAQGALFSQVTQNKVEQASETLDGVAKKIVAEDFGGDTSKYAEALIEAGKRNPALVPAEMRTRKIRQ